MMSIFKKDQNKNQSESAIIEVPSVPAEYDYIQGLQCERCGRSVEGDRKGSAPSGDGRMYDYWEVTCRGCGSSERIILSVPSVGKRFKDLLKMPGDDQGA